MNNRFLYPLKWHWLALGMVLGFLSACSGRDESGQRIAHQDSEEQLLAHGHQQSRLCLGCHGPQGVSRVNSYPSLAGKSRDHLRRELTAFRDGTRDNPLMSSVVKSLSDRDIQALSLYYSQQKLPIQVQDHSL